MAEEPQNLLIEHLRYIRGAVDGLREDMHEVKTRLGLIEETCASLSRRLDRLDDRVDRIERRLDLMPAPTG
jgi:predicted nuclease with TOPRIM domain